MAATLIGLSIQVRRGRFDEFALAGVLAAAVLAAASLRGGGVPAPAMRTTAAVRGVVRALVLVQLAAFVPLLDTHLLDEGHTVLAGSLFAVVVVLALDQVGEAPRTGDWGRAGLLAAVGGLGLLWLVANPTEIDVRMFQEVGVDRLLAGQNPWAPGYPNMYSAGETAVFYGEGLVEGDRLSFGFPYPPLSLLLAAPGALVGDVRVMHLLALLGTGGLLLTMVRDSWAARAGGVLLLTTPLLLRMAEWAFTEAFMALTLAAALWALRRGSGLASVVAVGLFLASKQYAVLFLPVLLWVAPTLRTAGERWWLAWRAALIAAAVTLPGLVWDAGAFVFSVGLLHLHQPFRADSLSVLAFSVTHWDVPPDSLVPAVIVAATAAGLAWTWARASRTWWGVAVGVATVQLAFVLCNRQAFTNYYFLAATALCLAVALRDAPAEVGVSA